MEMRDYIELEADLARWCNDEDFPNPQELSDILRMLPKILREPGFMRPEIAQCVMHLSGLADPSSEMTELEKEDFRDELYLLWGFVSAHNCQYSSE